jgi:uncharacterized protein YggU (UPF0235/DUF167 family)
MNRIENVRVEVHVRPGASRTLVGGEHDGVLLVRVTEPADAGRATEASLRAVAWAAGVPRQSVRLLRGATGRRKLLEIEAGKGGAEKVRMTLHRLQVGTSG